MAGLCWQCRDIPVDDACIECGGETEFIDVLGIPWCAVCWDEADRLAGENARRAWDESDALE